MQLKKTLMVVDYEILSDRVVILAKGKDLYKYFQGLITNDIAKLDTQGSIYSFILTPQGKYLFDMILTKQGNDILIDTAKSQYEALLAKLNFYKFRLDVSFSLTSLIVAVTKEKIELPEGFSIADPRNGMNMWRHYMQQISNPKFSLTNKPFYELGRINAKIPESDKDYTQEKSFPLEFGADKIGAIDFDKGCYVGQEVTTRTFRQGVIRKAIYLLDIGSLQPIKNAEIKVGEAVIGVILSYYNNRALALLRKQELEEFLANGRSLSVDNNPISLI